MSVVATTEERTAPSRVARRTTSAAALASLGIVYGDLGTSRLYTLQVIIQTIGVQFTPEAALGVLSLILWALVITISLKYCLFVMRADNHCEGGILALMPLAGATGFDRGRALVVMGLFGAALLARWLNFVPPPPLSGGDHPARGLGLFAFHIELSSVEELLAERGLDISHETVRCWVLKFGPANRATAAPASPSAEQSLAFGRDGGAHRPRADVSMARRR